MSGLKSRNKGKRGERELVAFLRSYGIECRRGQQYRGGKDSPDVLLDDLQTWWHIECKVGYGFSWKRLVAWWKQASNEAGPGKTTLVFWKPPRQNWLVFAENRLYDADWYLRIYRYRPKSADGEE